MFPEATLLQNRVRFAAVCCDLGALTGSSTLNISLITGIRALLVPSFGGWMPFLKGMAVISYPVASQSVVPASARNLIEIK